VPTNEITDDPADESPVCRPPLLALNGRMPARLRVPLASTGTQLLVGWLDAVSGRGLQAGPAPNSRGGELRAPSRQAWIQQTCIEQTWIELARADAPR
jgi:hypothetical protein